MESSDDACSLSARRVLQRCDELALITEEPGRITRGFLTPSMQEVNLRVSQWMQQAGLTTHQDDAGNLIGQRGGAASSAPVLVLGSHLDTVRNAGAYDGILGVLLAIAVVEALGETALPFDIEVVAFSDEEGLRYGVPFLGSLALIGELDAELMTCVDDDDISVAQAIRQAGGNPDALPPPRYENRPVIGYLEAHIEQGPCLEHHGLALGVLEALCGACWMRCAFDGRAGHAGTTPMELRADALPAAAELVLETERLGRRVDDLVATVGKLTATPGAGNVIPGGAELRLDVRHPHRAGLTSAVKHLVEAGRDIARRRGLEFQYEILHHQDGIQADPWLSEHLEKAAAAAGHGAKRLLIGAGHDTLIMARQMPVTMLLVRSPGGISHHPDENVLPEDVDAALTVMEQFIRRLADSASEVTGQTPWMPSWDGPPSGAVDTLRVEDLEG